jgi:catechol 2,3-dioxygenase-like lactoylglutathione lyase family enzyme
MITKLSHATIWVLDQDEALGFYRDKLGFEVGTDQTMGDFRWLTVHPPGQPDLELILMVPGPPQMPPEAAEQIKALIAKGAMGSGVFGTDDCRGTYAELSERGVEFLEEPAERFYGIEATFRDNSGNWFSLTQRAPS